MTQEERELVLKDLCARLPYGLKLEHYGPESRRQITCTLLGVDIFVNDALQKCENPVLFDMKGNPFRCPVSYIKPYLRPMSSMTEEELKELNEKYGNIAYFFIQEPPYYHGLQAQHSDIGSIEISEFSEIYDWMNAHHLDYRGLIPKGLALEAPEDMYKF